MTEDSAHKVIGKEELLASLDGLKVLCREYGELMGNVWATDTLNEEGKGILNSHRALARSADAPMRHVAPLSGLLRFLLRRMTEGALVFHLPTQQVQLPEEENLQLARISEDLRHLQRSMEQVVGRVTEQVQQLPPAATPRTGMLLMAVTSLFKGVVRQDWDDVALFMNHINMVTTSSRSHELVERIGRLVRDIYESLNQFSQDYDMEGLSTSTDELPDAVDKLNSVIHELENSANRNLDLLEALSDQVNDGKEHAQSALDSLKSCTAALDAMSEHLRVERQADAGADDADIAEIKTLLETTVQRPLEKHWTTLEENHEAYMTLFASQSYQDLTGQTLKKVITFIESLQYQLIRVITNEKVPLAEPGELNKTGTGEENAAMVQGPDAADRLSQDKVDNLLAELGF